MPTIASGAKHVRESVQLEIVGPFPPGNATSGLQAIQQTPNRDDNQRWSVDQLADGSYEISNKATGGALDKFQLFGDWVQRLPKERLRGGRGGVEAWANMGRCEAAVLFQVPSSRPYRPQRAMARR